MKGRHKTLCILWLNETDGSYSRKRSFKKNEHLNKCGLFNCEEELRYKLESGKSTFKEKGYMVEDRGTVISPGLTNRRPQGTTTPDTRHKVLRHKN